MTEKNNTGLNVNINLQQTSNYMIIMKSDQNFNAEDLTFYAKTFKIPGISLSPTELGFQPNKIKFPTQGNMTYEELSLDILLDDNLNSYLQLAKWMHRLKNPEKLWTAAPNMNHNPYSPRGNPKALKPLLDSSTQFPIEYRDIHVHIMDTNHQLAYKFIFEDAWIYQISNFELNPKSEYITFNSSFYYMLMKIYDSKGNRIIPIIDEHESEFLSPEEEIE